MLFALIDYWKYKSKYGPYSSENIKAQGGKIASVENFPNFRDYGAGKLFSYHGCDSFLSWMVMYFTSSIWSHTGMFTKNGKVIDATTSGVIEHPISDYFDGKSYICIMEMRQEVATKEQLQKSTEWARNQVGKSYNWIGVIKMVLGIIFGAHAGYRFRISLDILLTAILLIPFCLLSEIVCDILLLLVCVYVAVIIINTPKRARMRKKLIES